MHDHMSWNMSQNIVLYCIALCCVAAFTNDVTSINHWYGSQTKVATRLFSKVVTRLLTIDTVRKRRRRELSELIRNAAFTQTLCLSKKRTLRTNSKRCIHQWCCDVPAHVRYLFGVAKPKAKCESCERPSKLEEGPGVFFRNSVEVC